MAPADRSGRPSDGAAHTHAHPAPPAPVVDMHADATVVPVWASAAATAAAKAEMETGAGMAGRGMSRSVSTLTGLQTLSAATAVALPPPPPSLAMAATAAPAPLPGNDAALLAFGIAGNIVATVGIILINKHLYTHLAFRFMATLTCLHFTVTAIAMRLLRRLGYFSIPVRPLMQIMPVALGCVGSVAFGNLSLATNSVGFYQLAKLVCIPATLLAEYALYGRVPSMRIMLTLTVMLVGIGLATVTDVSANWLGSAFATLAVVSTVFAQIVTQSRQAALNLSSIQLLHLTAPWTALGLLPLVVLFDDVSGGPDSLQAYTLTQASCVALLISCLFAVGCNTTNFLVIGKAGPVPYQVVGHVKTLLILVFGFVIFRYPVVPKNISGIVLAMIGVILYGEVKRRRR